MRIWLPNAALLRSIREAIDLVQGVTAPNFDDALTLALFGFSGSYDDALTLFMNSEDILSMYLITKHTLRNQKTSEAIEKMRKLKNKIRHECAAGALDELLCLRLRAFNHASAYQRLLELYGSANPLDLADAFISYNHERLGLKLLETHHPRTSHEALRELTVFRRAMGLTAMKGSLIIGVNHLSYLDWLIIEGVGGGLLLQFNNLHRAYTVSTSQVQAMEGRLLLHDASWEIEENDAVITRIKWRGGVLIFMGNPTPQVLRLELPGEGVVKTFTAEFRWRGELLVPPMDYVSVMI